MHRWWRLRTSDTTFNFKIEKEPELREGHYFFLDSNIIHRNIGDKQNIAFPQLVGILTSSSVMRNFPPSCVPIMNSK